MPNFKFIAVHPAMLFLTLLGADNNLFATELGKQDRPVVGLVLSGGGARGAAHVGVLGIIEKMRVPVDIITGTSMGAIAGGLYAYGYSPAELELLLSQADWEVLFSDRAPRRGLSPRRKTDYLGYPVKNEMGFKNRSFYMPTGLLEGQKLNVYLKSLTLHAPTKFSDLPINFRAVATDIETGEDVVLGEGSLAESLRASLSIPGIFAPVEWDGRLLVDGGIVNNVPVKLAREMGAEILIVVDLSSKLKNRKDLGSPFSILGQSIDISIQRATSFQLDALGDRDILIQPDTSGFSSTDFKRIKELTQIGILAAQSQSEKLKVLSLSESDYTQYLAKKQRPTRPLRVDRVVVQNQSRMSDSVIETYIQTRPGPLNMKELEQDIEKLNGLDIFESVDFDLETSDGTSTLVLTTKQKAWGPNFLRFGANIANNFNAEPTESHLSLTANTVPVGSSGSEWRTELQLGYNDVFHTEFYQPLDRRLEFYVRPWFRFEQTHLNDFTKTRDVVNDTLVATAQLGFVAGRWFGSQFSVELGLNRAFGDSVPNTGKLSINNHDADLGAWELRMVYDDLDSMEFPTSGSLASVHWLGLRQTLGNAGEQDRVRINLLLSETFGKNTLTFWGSVGAVVGGDVEPDTGYTLGGLFSLSGLERNSYMGRYTGIARILYTGDYINWPTLIDIPLYFGMSVEAGNAWNDSSEIDVGTLVLAGSLFVGVDTPIGPLYLAQGFSRHSETKSYLFLGHNLSFF
ncbi:MAG: patatin-like phospholipase family protein [Gammaproteobacteria bacterium]|nr:patatin-like phospholipase family protein [Gammaproteobacteria bacterium]MDH5801530.1 patatin-like phospholipase family protein [Gammaproteobacteria bacterium]